MHHVVLERWSRGNTWLHRRDPRAKFGALLVFLVVLATAEHALPLFGLTLLVLLAAAVATAGIPLRGALGRALLVLPFAAIFGGLCWISGEGERGIAIVVKSYLSALAVLTVVSTTPIPLLLSGLERAGAPHFLLLVAQFLYRYLFVISEEAQHMRASAVARGGVSGGGLRPARFRAAAGALAVLFVRSFGRAEEIHNAMLARAFSGRFRSLAAPRFQMTDAVFLVTASAMPLLLRVAVERWM